MKIILIMLATLALRVAAAPVSIETAAAVLPAEPEVIEERSNWCTAIGEACF
jgi:hypothetical protein